jgi:Fe-S cluster biogenesis protein NfuA
MPDDSAEPTAPAVETGSATPVAVSVGISSRSHGGPIDDAERETRKAGLNDLMDLMRPAIQADGGDIVILAVDYDEGVVEVQLQGACGSCAIASVTLQGGVERILKERLAWVSEVKGGVDESMDPFESASMGRGAYVPRWE